jgi:hypothetical protein
MPLSSKREVTKYVHRKILFRLRRLGITFLIITGILIYELTQYYVAFYTAVAGYSIGIFIGWLLSQRMHVISWNAEANKTVSRMDRIGIIILVCYIIFAILRHWIFSHWLNGHALTAFSLSIASGGMLTRFYHTRKQVRKILIDEGVMKKLKQKTTGVIDEAEA